MEQLWILTLVCVAARCDFPVDPSPPDKNMYTSELMCEETGLKILRSHPTNRVAACVKVVRPK